MDEQVEKLCKILHNSFGSCFLQEWKYLYRIKYVEEKNLEQMYEEKKKKEMEHISEIFSNTPDFINNYQKYFNEFYNFDLSNQEFFKKNLANGY